MSPTMLANETAAYAGPSIPALLDAMLDALVTERRLLDDLIAQMRRQRSAVGAEDIQGVDDSTFATHRILATLGQARQRRRQLNLLLGGSEECTLTDLEQLIGQQMDSRFSDAKQRLQHAADMLAREVGMNRKLLREAISANDHHVRTLVGGSANASTYGGDGAAPAPPPPARGVLVNRTA